MYHANGAASKCQFFSLGYKDVFLYAGLKVPAQRMLVAKLYFLLEGFLKHAFR